MALNNRDYAGSYVAALLAGVASLTPGQAMAAEQATTSIPAAESDGEQGDVIVVTAERRNTSVQNVPMVVQVLGGEQLQQRGITSLDQIAVLTPGLKVDNNAGRGYVYLRGIGTDAVGIGVDPSVATYVDGVYLSRGNAIFGGLWDVDHVEVLKGPQGTLYGRNATGGAILTVTRQPRLGELSGYGLVGYGNLDRKRAEAAVNLPLGDKAALRVSGMFLADDGYMNNLFTGKKEGGQNIKGGRATLLVEPFAGLSATVSGYAVKQSGGRGATFKLDTAQPSPTLAANPTITVPSGRYDVNYNLQNNATLDARGASLVLDYGAGPVAIKSTTGYNYIRSNRVLDFDATQILANETYQGIESSKAFSQSLQLNNADQGTFNWMLGADYLHEVLAADIRSRFNNRADRILQARNRVDAVSLFVDLNYELAPGLKILAGGRQSFEIKNFTFTTPSRGSWKQFTPKFGLQYEVQPDVMLYTTASRGFKSGGFNSSAVQPPFGPEKIWSYEAGVKSSLFDRKVTANLSVFHYDYTDLQVTQIDPNNGAVPITTNAGSAKVTGVDGEFVFRPVPAFRLGANFTYIDSKFGQLALQDPSLAGSPFVNVAGNQFSRAPEFSGSLDAAYTWETGDRSITLGADVRYSSRIYFSPFETSFVSQPEYAVANARLTWERGPVEVSAFVKNLTDKFYYVTVQTFPTAIGTSYLPAEPRTYGMSIKYSF